MKKNELGLRFDFTMENWKILELRCWRLCTESLLPARYLQRKHWNQWNGKGARTTVTDNTGKLLYNVKEMRQALGIGKNSAYDLLKRNDFPKIIINGRYYIPVDKLKKWIDKETNRSLRRSA